MFDFNSITQEQEKLATAKFKEFGVGVNMAKYTSTNRFTGADTAKWADLTDPQLYSISAIKQKMLEVARTINTNCNDEFLGDLNTAFMIRDNREKQVKFSYQEMYTFLRAAFRYRMETEEYKSNKREMQELESFIESKKSAKEKVAEAKKRLKVLSKEVD